MEIFDPATTVQILSDQLACMLNIPNSNDVPTGKTAQTFATSICLAHQL